MAKKEIKLKAEHYYMENGLMVFTEKYHLDKGYCCNNDCRHCPYPLKDDPKDKSAKKSTK